MMDFGRTRRNKTKKSNTFFYLRPGFRDIGSEKVSNFQTNCSARKLLFALC